MFRMLCSHIHDTNERVTDSTHECVTNPTCMYMCIEYFAVTYTNKVTNSTYECVTNPTSMYMCIEYFAVTYMKVTLYLFGMSHGKYMNELRLDERVTNYTMKESRTLHCVTFMNVTRSLPEMSYGAHMDAQCHTYADATHTRENNKRRRSHSTHTQKKKTYAQTYKDTYTETCAQSPILIEV